MVLNSQPVFLTPNTLFDETVKVFKFSSRNKKAILDEIKKMDSSNGTNIYENQICHCENCVKDKSHIYFLYNVNNLSRILFPTKYDIKCAIIKDNFSFNEKYTYIELGYDAQHKYIVFNKKSIVLLSKEAFKLFFDEKSPLKRD